MESLEIPVSSAKMNGAEHLEDSVVSALVSMGYDAEGTGADTRYADILVKNPVRFGVEVKQARAQFGSAKINWMGGEWMASKSSASDPFVAAIVKEMNESKQCRKFISCLYAWVCLQRKIPIGSLPHIALIRSDRGVAYRNNDLLDVVVKPHELLSFTQFRGGQDIIKEIRDASPLIQMHYLHGKKERTPYLQWEDNFYTFDPDHPMKGEILDGGEIPLFENVKTSFRISIAFASDKRYYFVVPRIMPITITSSPYSLLSPMKPRSKKIFPFKPTEYAHEHLKKRVKNFESMLEAAARSFGAPA